MGKDSILNNLKGAEIRALMNSSERILRKCKFCDDEVLMRPGQYFCCLAHHAAMGRLTSAEEVLAKDMQIEALKREVAELGKELRELRKSRRTTSSSSLDDEWYMKKA